MKTKSTFLAIFIATIVATSFKETKAQWSLSGNGNASTSSKLGTTNAVPLRLFTNNFPRMTITPAGDVGIGTTTPDARLEVKRTDGDFVVARFTNAATVGDRTALIDILNGQGDIWSYAVGGTGNGLGLTNGEFYIERVNGGAFLIITKEGNVGIGTKPVNTIKLASLYSNNNQGRYIGASGQAFASVQTAGIERIGVYGYGFNGEKSYGVYGHATHGKNNYGVYGKADVGTFNAAGYFSGDVWANSYKTISDRKFKTGVSPLKNSLEQLMKLKPSAYEFKTTEYANMGLPKGKQIGLIADEVKQVFPELVNQGVHPAQYNEDNKTLLSPEEEFEGVNYQGFIPVLIAAVQEQQQTILSLKAENGELKKEVAKLGQLIMDLKSGNSNSNVPLSGAYLEANTPNPFNNNTVIRYYIPTNVTNAKIVIIDMKGAVIKSIALNTKGSGQVTFHAAALAAGTYTYSLFVNNEQADTKKMVVIR